MAGCLSHCHQLMCMNFRSKRSQVVKVMDLRSIEFHVRVLQGHSNNLCPWPRHLTPITPHQTGVKRSSCEVTWKYCWAHAPCGIAPGDRVDVVHWCAPLGMVWIMHTHFHQWDDKTGERCGKGSGQGSRRCGPSRCPGSDCLNYAIRSWVCGCQPGVYVVKSCQVAFMKLIQEC